MLSFDVFSSVFSLASLSFHAAALLMLPEFLRRNDTVCSAVNPTTVDWVNGIITDKQT